MLKWLAAVSISLGKDSTELYLQDILGPVHRELDIVTTYKGNHFLRTFPVITHLGL